MIRKLFKYILILSCTFLWVGCAKHQLSTWHLKPHEQLLAKNKIEFIDNKKINKEEISSYIRQQPNKSFLFGKWKIGLQWKNLWYRSASGKKRPGVVIDSILVERSQKQLEIYMKNQGFYNAEVSTKITPHYLWGIKRWEQKKATVHYIIKTGLPLLIDSLGWEIEQENIIKYYKQIESKSTIQKGNVLKIEDLEEERSRISQHLNNNGFYKFAENYLRFNIDTSRGKDSTIIITKIKKPIKDVHHRYFIRDIYINTTFDPYNSNNETTDTTLYKGVYFISKGKSAFHPAPLYRSLFIHPGEIYSEQNQSQTFRQFVNLQTFNFIKIDFKEPLDTSAIKELDAYILLQPSKRMSVSAEIMGIFREGFGANGQISFTRKNAFGNAEILNFSISGGFENLKQIDDDDFKIGSNIGPRLSLTFPRLFLMPKITNNIRKNAYPKTTLSSYFNYQQRSQFARYLTNFSLNYEWNEGKYKKHEISIPNVSISFIRKDSKILSTLNDLSPQQKFKFEDAISTGVKYAFIYNNQSNERVKHPTFLTAKGWLIGPTALLAEALNIEARDAETNAITLAGIRYATFIKAQSDLRKYFNFFNEQQIALRSFIGFGIPLDKDGVIPFDQLYFSGGANSVRGWRQRTLGPGSYFDPNDNLDRLGEIKLELSAEYRFPITSIIKGALFTDAGNVWTESPQSDEVTQTRNFDFHRFHREIAVSPGVGIRLDFDFFLFRLDMGVPLKQAYHVNQWKLEPNQTQFNFGIGYPF